ncbi:MAG TPA: hypothetical protein VNO75_12160 [Gemmatimonadaceae bacterium]|nr:hypothetical protein [Gemmatimonadaceae bacterium]
MTYEQALGFQDSASRVYDAISAGARGAASKVLKEFTADAVIRSTRAQHWIPSATLTLPPEMERELARHLSVLLVGRDHLWIDLAEPVGYLPLIPWESLLQPLTKVPVLRLSPHPVKALGSNHELNVVLVSSFCSAESVPKVAEVRGFVEAIRSALPRQSTINIFADSLSHGVFVEATASATGDAGRQLIVHKPPLSPAAFRTNPGSDVNAVAAEGSGESTDSREHPWLSWMTSALGGSAVDIIHWISPGSLFSDRARLTVARSPQPEEISANAQESSRVNFWKRAKKGRAVRYLNAQSLAAAATSFGAWAMLLTIPSRGRGRNRSKLALRLLADQLSRTRPGVVALHDLATDSGAGSLSHVYGFLAASGSQYPVMPGVVTYCHPARVALELPTPPAPVDSELASAYAAVSEAVQARLNEPGPTPAWVATTQRVVEQMASRLVFQAEDQLAEKSPLDAATERGMVEALRVVERLLADESIQEKL